MSLVTKIFSITPNKKATFVANIAYNAAFSACKKLNQKNYQAFSKIISEEPQTREETRLIKKIATGVLKDRKLIQKGVKIKNVNKAAIEGELPNATLRQIARYKKGESAIFLTKPILYKDGGKYADANEILINCKNPHLFLLHELGHADNYNNSKILKTLMKSRNAEPIITDIARQSALLGESNSSKPYSTFIHKNSALIGALAQAPILIDEAVASIKAVGWIKKYGGKKLAKQAQKELTSAYLAYITHSLAKVAPIQASKVTKDITLRKFQTKI